MIIAIFILYIFNSAFFGFSYPKEVGVSQSCLTEKVDVSFDIKNYTMDVVILHSFGLDEKDFELYFNDNKVNLSDTILLGSFEEVKVNLKYKIENSKKPFSSFIFKSNLEKYKENEIKLIYGGYKIDPVKLEDEEDQIIFVSLGCLDSVRIYFPGYSTETNVFIFKGIGEDEKYIKRVDFGIGSYRNYITFSKNELGKYYVYHAGCYSSKSFWLTLK